MMMEPSTSRRNFVFQLLKCFSLVNSEKNTRKCIHDDPLYHISIYPYMLVSCFIKAVGYPLAKADLSDLMIGFIHGDQIRAGSLKIIGYTLWILHSYDSTTFDDLSNFFRNRGPEEYPFMQRILRYPGIRGSRQETFVSNPASGFQSFLWLVVANTHLRINMDTQKGWFGKVSPFKYGNFEISGVYFFFCIHFLCVLF